MAGSARPRSISQRASGLSRACVTGSRYRAALAPATLKLRRSIQARHRRSKSKAGTASSTVQPMEEAVPAFDFERLWRAWRSEEHTSELQSQSKLLCPLLLEKKKKRDRHT